jgi:hypothetical protein
MAVQFLDLLSADHHAIDADFYRALGNVFTTAQIVELGFACTEMMGVYLLDHEDAPYDVALVFEKLKYAEWTAWPEPAIEAIRVFVEAIVQQLMEQPLHARAASGCEMVELQSREVHSILLLAGPRRSRPESRRESRRLFGTGAVILRAPRRGFPPR